MIDEQYNSSVEFKDSLEKFLLSKEQERAYSERPIGWTRWHVTNAGENRQGWIRWHNSNAFYYETPRQIVYPKGANHYKFVCANDSGLEYCTFLFNSAEEAMYIAENFTSQLDIMTDTEVFDQMRYLAFRRSMQEFPPKNDFHRAKLNEFKGHRVGTMDQDESNQLRYDYKMLYDETEHMGPDLEDSSIPYEIKGE